MRVKVLHVIGSLETGGAETAMARMCQATQASALEHRVLVLGRTGRLEGVLRDAGIPVLAPRVRPSDLVQVLRLSAAWHPQVIQGWMYHGSLAASALKSVLFQGAALAWNIRCGLDTPGHYRVSTRSLIRFLAKRSRLPEAIVYNAVSARAGHEAAGYEQRRAEVIPNGFDLDLFRPDAFHRDELRAELGLPVETELVGLVARCHPEKNPELFLRALAHLSARVHGLLVGPGMVPENPVLANQIRNLGLPGRAHLLGERQDMPRILAGLDIAVSASWNEGFSNALGEAQACGVPCVATEVGDSALLVGGLGRLVSPGDGAAMAQALVELLGLSREERVVLGHRCRQRMRDDYSLPRVARHYSELYQRLADRL